MFFCGQSIYKTRKSLYSHEKYNGKALVNKWKDKRFKTLLSRIPNYQLPPIGSKIMHR